VHPRVEAEAGVGRDRGSEISGAEITGSEERRKRRENHELGGRTVRTLCGAGKAGDGKGVARR
jgi:hypothetical protein